MKLLLIEDSEPLRRGLKVGLNHLGFTVDETGDGSEGLSMALTNCYDFILLDLMLPHVDGISLLKSIRKQGKQTKVIILSAKSSPQNRVEGLLSGADDYLCKPFSFDELHARIIAISRRGEINNSDNTLAIGEFSLDLVRKHFSYQGKMIDLTKNEFKIIECLFFSKEQVVNPEQISEAVAGSFSFLSKNTIEAHLSSVRRKVRAVNGVLPIKNKRGFGYIAGEF